MKPLFSAGIMAICLLTACSKNGGKSVTPVIIDSSKLTNNNIIYTTGDIGQLVALNANTGSVKWSFTLDKNVNINSTIINSSPTYDNGTIYIGSSDHNVYAIDANTGAKKWNFQTQSYNNFFAMFESSPIVVNGTVFIGGDKLYAIDAASGTLKWSYQASREFVTSPCYYNGYVYANANDGNCYMLNASDGNLVELVTRIVPTMGANFGQSSPRIHKGIMYGIGETDSRGADISLGLLIKNLDAIDDLQWLESFPSKNVGIVESSTPVFSGDSMYIALDSTIYAFDVNKLGYSPWKWKVKIKGGFYQSIPVADSTYVFVGSTDGIVYAIKAADGSESWEFNTGDGAIISSPTLANGLLFFASENSLHAVWADTGKELWRKSTFGNYYSQSSACVVAKNGAVFHSNSTALNN